MKKKLFKMFLILCMMYTSFFLATNVSKNSNYYKQSVEYLCSTIYNDSINTTRTPHSIETPDLLQ